MAREIPQEGGTAIGNFLIEHCFERDAQSGALIGKKVSKKDAVEWV